MKTMSLTSKTANWVEADGWYRGDVINLFPTKSELRDPGGLEKYILHGWMPDQPIISREMPVTVFGSCFAHYVEEYLAKKGYRVGANLYGNGSMPSIADTNSWSYSLIVRCSEAFVNTFALRYQFEWIYEGTIPSLRLWHKSEHNIKEYIDDNKEAAAAILTNTDVFVMTLGLSEVWYDKQTGEVMWTSVPKSVFDPDKHGFRVTSVAENLENLERVYSLIRKYRGDVPIIFTLSPVPLYATFRPVSCVTASSVSKAILRVAVDEMVRAHPDDKKLFYFPSYEMIKDYFPDAYAEDYRHVLWPYVDQVMQVFEKYFCVADN
jgi:hypothetical protein